MRQEPIIEMDVHGMTVDQAIAKIEAQIKRANASTYRIRIIHGYNRGNNIQRGIYSELKNRGDLPEFRITGGSNPGITEIVLREY